MVPDLVTFRSGINTVIEHGAVCDTPDEYNTQYTTLAYYYLMPDRTMVKTDEKIADR